MIVAAKTLKHIIAFMYMCKRLLLFITGSRVLWGYARQCILLYIPYRHNPYWYRAGVEAMPVCICPFCDHRIVLRVSFSGLHCWYVGLYIMTWYIDGDLVASNLVEHKQFGCCPSLF